MSESAFQNAEAELLWSQIRTLPEYKRDFKLQTQWNKQFLQPFSQSPAKPLLEQCRKTWGFYPLHDPRKRKAPKLFVVHIRGLARAIPPHGLPVTVLGKMFPKHQSNKLVVSIDLAYPNDKIVKIVENRIDLVRCFRKLKVKKKSSSSFYEWYFVQVLSNLGKGATEITKLVYPSYKDYQDDPSIARRKQIVRLMKKSYTTFGRIT